MSVRRANCNRNPIACVCYSSFLCLFSWDVLVSWRYSILTQTCRWELRSPLPVVVSLPTKLLLHWPPLDLHSCPLGHMDDKGYTNGRLEESR